MKESEKTKSIAFEWCRKNTVWRYHKENGGMITIKPSSLVKLIEERDDYKEVLEEIAGNESGVNAEKADGLAIGILSKYM